MDRARRARARAAGGCSGASDARHDGAYADGSESVRSNNVSSTRLLGKTAKKATADDNPMQQM